MEAPPKVPIVGVPATSGGRRVPEEMGMIAILLLKIYVRGWLVKSRWGTSVDAHEGRYFVWCSGSESGGGGGDDIFGYYFW